MCEKSSVLNTDNSTNWEKIKLKLNMDIFIFRYINVLLNTVWLKRRDDTAVENNCGIFYSNTFLKRLMVILTSSISLICTPGPRPPRPLAALL